MYTKSPPAANNFEKIMSKLFLEKKNNIYIFFKDKKAYNIYIYIYL